jgi:hypothetical protein
MNIIAIDPSYPMSSLKGETALSTIMKELDHAESILLIFDHPTHGNKPVQENKFQTAPIPNDRLYSVMSKALEITHKLQTSSVRLHAMTFTDLTDEWLEFALASHSFVTARTDLNFALTGLKDGRPPLTFLGNQSIRARIFFNRLRTLRESTLNITQMRQLNLLDATFSIGEREDFEYLTGLYQAIEFAKEPLWSSPSKKKSRISWLSPSRAPTALRKVEEFKDPLKWYDYICSTSQQDKLKFKDSQQALRHLFKSQCVQQITQHSHALTRSHNQTSVLRLLIEAPPPSPELLATIAGSFVHIILYSYNTRSLMSYLEDLKDALNSQYGPTLGSQLFDRYVDWALSKYSKCDEDKIYEWDVFGFVRSQIPKQPSYYFVDYGSSSGEKVVLEVLSTDDDTLGDDVLGNLPAIRFVSQGVGINQMPVSIWLRCIMFDELLSLPKSTSIGLAEIIGHLNDLDWGFLGNEPQVESFFKLRTEYLIYEAKDFVIGAIRPKTRNWQIRYWPELALASPNTTEHLRGMESVELQLMLALSTIRDTLRQHRPKADDHWDSLIPAIMGIEHKWPTLSAYFDKMHPRQYQKLMSVTRQRLESNTKDLND